MEKDTNVEEQNILQANALETEILNEEDLDDASGGCSLPRLIKEAKDTVKNAVKAAACAVIGAF